MAQPADDEALAEALAWVEELQAENENLRRQVFRAESIIVEYRQELDAQGFELKKLSAELKLQSQLAQTTA
ncbi:hypothetical protein [Glutamicibacter nicotianae]|uniref:Transposase n=1 Tax=Glutamicibacter nicotianae TaxID=37929 RepID=A0ABQ0RLN8_GLUNI|nr:hypothetical protein [Glutamicibacter nicotianae]GEC12739.1 hypothetical protein ANI01nite_19420 [Glutamicibacter nicotianae]